MATNDRVTVLSLFSLVGLFVLFMAVQSGQIAATDVPTILVMTQGALVVLFLFGAFFLKSANRLQNWTKGSIVLGAPLLLLMLWINIIRIGVALMSLVTFFVAELGQRFVRVWENDQLSGLVWAIFVNQYQVGMVTEMEQSDAAYKSELHKKDVEIEALKKQVRLMGKTVTRQNQDLQYLVSMQTQADAYGMSVQQLRGWYDEAVKRAGQAALNPQQNGKKGKQTNNNGNTPGYVPTMPSMVPPMPPMGQNGNSNGKGKQAGNGNGRYANAATVAPVAVQQKNQHAPA